MKLLVAAFVASSVLAVPIASFAQQTNERLTRAQVRAQIVQLERVGYTPGSFDPQYPASIQAAQERVAAQNGTPQAETSGVGSSAGSSSKSGRPDTALSTR